MPVAIAGRAPATFEIKSANLPLVALLLKSADLPSLEEELQARFGEVPDFFDHDAMLIDLSPLRGEAVPDFRALVALLKRYRTLPVAVKGASAEQLEAARDAGLASAADAVETRAASAAERPSDASPSPVPQDAPVPRSPAPSALVVDKPLRSGQQVYARGRDLVVTAMVNPGAEVIADGHIHVYAPLRGKAMAGARGNAEARIFTMSLQPQLISIAGVYRTSEVPWPAEVEGKPAMIRLEGGAEDGRLVVERMR